MENKHTLTDLYQMQALPLSAKIRMTKYRIRQWIEEYGEDGVYVSFSGGKDSTVLLNIVRQDYPQIPAVFVDVPTQYPELKETDDNRLRSNGRYAMRRTETKQRELQESNDGDYP